MKIRNGFVSNSSSSSYIVSCSDKSIKSIDTFFHKKEVYNTDDTQIIAKGIQNIVDMYIEVHHEEVELYKDVSVIGVLISNLLDLSKLLESYKDNNNNNLVLIKIDQRDDTTLKLLFNTNDINLVGNMYY